MRVTLVLKILVSLVIISVVSILGFRLVLFNNYPDSVKNIYFNDKFNASSSIEHSVESHYMALAAERSRIQGGKLVELSDYRK